MASSSGFTKEQVRKNYCLIQRQRNHIRSIRLSVFRTVPFREGLIPSRLQRYCTRLVEIRTVLEKIRPIDQRLKYQIDKLVKTSVEGKADSDPLRFKANPDDLDSDEESDDDKDTGKVKYKGKSDVYRPPRITPQHFEDEEEDQAKSAAKTKRKSINRALIRELQEEFLDTPIEVHNLGDAYSKQLSRETRDKQRYEETNFTRLPMTKHEKHKESRISTLGALGDEITDFSRKRSAGATSSSSKAKKRNQSKGGKKKFRK